MMKGTLVEEDVEDFSKDFIVKLGTLLKSGQFGKKKKKEHDRCLYFFYDKRSNDNWYFWKIDCNFVNLIPLY